MDEIERLRSEVDELDAQIVELLNRRARVIVEIGNVKRANQIPIYAPHREQAVLQRALSMNEGPLPDRTIEGVFRELMSGSFVLEQPIRVGYLGPPGSFSHVAAVAQFGSSVDLEDFPDIRAVFSQVRRGHARYGIVPIENSTIGGVVDTLDAFAASRSEVAVYAEVLVSIRHNLLSNEPVERIQRIYSRPEVFPQCRDWLNVHFPKAELMAESSSSNAVMRAKDEAHAAAIGSDLAGRLYGVNLLFSDVEDDPNNVTRFFVLAKESAQPSGDDKTSIMFITKHEPGALVRVLDVFYRAGVNLTHIDKRPSRKKNWTYTFFVDCEGHQSEKQIQDAIERAREICQELSILGSYPRAQRIL
jgi:chorismate mutase / prephenate dehydratase